MPEHWAALAFSMWSFAIALGVYAFEAGGAALVGVAALVRLLPGALASPFAGTLGDRLSRRLVLVGGTFLPIYGGAEANAVRVAVNEWVRDQQLAAGVVDFDRALRDPSDPSQLAPTYDSSDHLHPSMAGYRAMAAAVPLGRLIKTAAP